MHVAAAKVTRCQARGHGLWLEVPTTSTKKLTVHPTARIPIMVAAWLIPVSDLTPRHLIPVLVLRIRGGKLVITYREMKRLLTTCIETRLDFQVRVQTRHFVIPLVAIIKLIPIIAHRRDDVLLSVANRRPGRPVVLLVCVGRRPHVLFDEKRAGARVVFGLIGNNDPV